MPGPPSTANNVDFSRDLLRPMARHKFQPNTAGQHGPAEWQVNTQSGCSQQIK